MKKVLLFITLSGLILIAIINSRTPFKIKNVGPWSVGYGQASSFPDSIPVHTNAIYSLEKLNQYHRETKFLADPFFLKVRDTFYLFFEHQLTTRREAVIGLMTSSDGVHYNYHGTVLKQPFHLSYPQVISYKQEFYMIPECHESNQVLMYKAQHFPFDWKICDTLIHDISLRDPTIYLSDSLNILVAYDGKLGMKMFVADSLFGRWKPHKKHTVITGSESRPGGRFFANGKDLLLPVQSCLDGYGYGLSLYNLDFKNGDYKVSRRKPLYLKDQPDIPEFNAGMHQLDMQRIGNQYYYVYDGNRLENQNRRWNVGGALKMTYYDLQFWLLQCFE
ncbi:hypothetical protein [Flavobacterium sp.]|uniref:glucosamine inositolphosphorylceramide transferase family protein n=1 Tax=Flavobacterium sp. TaxID=239 RepID=UPI002633D335|nr:hypothetical protein [Flavobacterium sp.]